MFTGIIERGGVVREWRRDEARDGGESRRLVIDAGGWPSDPKPGESISVGGCCLTLASAERGLLGFDVIPQTLACTTLGTWEPGWRVNLERSATPTTLLGGHLVLGHVDAAAPVLAIERSGEHRVRIGAPTAIAGLLVPRGSIAVDGVSLTIAATGDGFFEVCLIPETIARTTLGALGEGEFVNLEADSIAKLVEASVRRVLGK